MNTRKQVDRCEGLNEILVALQGTALQPVGFGLGVCCGPWAVDDGGPCTVFFLLQEAGPRGAWKPGRRGMGSPTKAGVFPCKAGWGGEGPPRAGLHPAWPPRGDCARWACLLTCGMRMTMKTGRETPALWHPTQRRPCPIPDPVTVLLHGKGSRAVRDQGASQLI